MAQYAGRASVALFTQIYFRDKKVSEEGYILFVRENALQVLLPKYGMECTLYVKDKPGGQQRIKVGREERRSTLLGIPLADRWARCAKIE